ncbi:geranylgeranylglyceryl/heptaprenylglyceryl phosphate synthase [Micromonospora sp. NPDC002575]|uniref:geranylgeranylglyceryl/heptaprenylglyceryl phosphate synthase n=1 Tax=Micromonospora sp. NPDC002575 TaxID=3364222 RepID=UPI0036A0C4C0
MREVRLPGNLSTVPVAAPVLTALRAQAPGLLHVVDPYKVPLAEAVEKSRAAADLGHPVLLVGSTDNAAFDRQVAPYVAALRERTDLPIVLHFPSIPGRGAPLCPGADAVLVHAVPNSLRSFFVSGGTNETAVAAAALGGAAPELLRSASFAFGSDGKTHEAVGAPPTAEGGSELPRLVAAVAAGDFDLAYLLYRHGRVPEAVLRAYRRGLAPQQLLFVGGGVRSYRQVRQYHDCGVDWVVVGNGLETAGWRETLRELSGRRGGRSGGDGHPAARPALVAELQRGLRRPARSDPAGRRAYATNVGRLHELLPAVVAPVTSAEEVAHVLRTTRAAGLPVAVRGSGHSFGRQGLSDGGVLIVGEPGDPEVRLHDDGTAEVSARAAWHAAETALNALGRSIPVLTNHLTVSIGGTLSVGGYGEGTIAHGGQVDLVERFRLILPDGQARWCSPDESPELFRYGIGSLGQLGVLDRVVLRTVGYQRLTTIATQRHPSLTALVEHVGWLAGEQRTPVDLFSAQHYEGGFVATYGMRGAPPPQRLPGRAEIRVEADWPLRSMRESRRNPADPSVHFIWADYCLSSPAAAEFARFLEAEILATPGYREGGGRLLMLGVHRPEQRPGVPFTPAAGLRGLALGFGLYFSVPRGDRAGVERVQGMHRRALAECLALGGRPYLAGWYDLAEADLQSMYGADLAALRRLRRELDPHGLFNPGLLA